MGMIFPGILPSRTQINRDMSKRSFLSQEMATNPFPGRLCVPPPRSAQGYRGARSNCGHKGVEPLRGPSWRSRLLQPRSSPCHYRAVSRAVRLEDKQLHTARIAAGLVAALKDSDPGVRAASASALGSHFGARFEGVVGALIQATTDNDAQVRLLSIQALRKMPVSGDFGISALLVALRDPDGAVRVGAAQALSAVTGHASEVAPGLIDALKDTDAAVRAAAATVLGTVIASDLRTDSDGAKTFHQLRSARAVSALSSVTGDGNLAVAQSACEALGEIGPGASAAIPALIRALEAGSREVRMSAAAALGEIGPTTPEVVPALIQAMERSRSDDLPALAAGITDPAGTAATALGKDGYRRRAGSAGARIDGSGGRAVLYAHQ